MHFGLRAAEAALFCGRKEGVRVSEIRKSLVDEKKRGRGCHKIEQRERARAGRVIIIISSTASTGWGCTTAYSNKGY